MGGGITYSDVYDSFKKIDARITEEEERQGVELTELRHYVNSQWESLKYVYDMGY